MTPQALEHADLQRTLRGPAVVRGTGLFTGAVVTATLRPAQGDSGITFRRVDLPGSPTIPARIEHVVERHRRTCLAHDQATIELTEHCLSALAGLGVDNAMIDVDGPELPAGDGSAAPYTDALASAGLVDQPQPRRPLVISEPVTVRDGEAMVTALPGDGGESELLYVLDYGPGSPIGRQVHAFRLGPAAYASEIAPARTFSTRSEAEAAWEKGLFKHLTPRDMLVVGDAGPIDNAWRFEGEPARHKLLDLVGDLALVGRPIRGRIIAVRSGHALNHRLARELVERSRGEVRPATTGVPGSSPVTGTPAMDIRSIMRFLPHRYPMILVDRVLEIEGDRRAVGVKNVTINEPFFQGHYPSTPIMPGVMIVEAMCQLSGLMLSQTLESAGKIAVLLSLDQVKLRKAVTPGDQLVLESRTVRATSRFGDVECRAFVGGELAAEAHVKFLLVDERPAR